MSDKHASDDQDCGLRRAHRRRLDSCFSDGTCYSQGGSSGSSFDQIGIQVEVPTEADFPNPHKGFFADECPICRDRDVEIEKMIHRLLDKGM